MSVRIVAFSGKAGSGKDTAVAALTSRQGPAQYMRMSFADNLKQLCQEYFNLTREQVHGSREEKEAIDPRYRVSGRHILIQVGQFMRTISPHIWEQMVFNDIQVHVSCDDCTRFAISDLRMRSEARFLKEQCHLNGYELKLIRIERPGIKLIDSITERDLDHYEFDHVVVNDGTIEDLRNKVRHLVR